MSFQFNEGGFNEVVRQGMAQKVPEIQARLASVPCPEHHKVSTAAADFDGSIKLTVCCDEQRERAEQVVALVFGR
jgi:hypothetical protein